MTIFNFELHWKIRNPLLRVTVTFVFYPIYLLLFTDLMKIVHVDERLSLMICQLYFIDNLWDMSV